MLLIGDSFCFYCHLRFLDYCETFDLDYVVYKWFFFFFFQFIVMMSYVFVLFLVSMLCKWRNV